MELSFDNNVIDEHKRVIYLPRHSTPTAPSPQEMIFVASPDGLAHSLKFKSCGEQSNLANIGGLMFVELVVKILLPNK